MNKNELADLVKSIRFYQGQKKESYTQEDMFNLEEQLRNKISNDLGGVVENEFNSVTARATEFENKFKAANLAKTELEDSFKTEKDALTVSSTDFKTKYEEATAKLKGFEVAEDKRAATTLLGGLVVKGAEYDVYNSLATAIKEVKFDKDATLEDKQAKIKPIVEGFTEAKPYFKPLVEERRSDNKSLITKSKKGEEQEDKIEFTGNVLRRNPDA